MLPFSNMLQYKNIYVLYCIVTLAALIIFFFLKIISLIHSVNTSFIGKEKVYIFHIYFLITTLYICICYLFFNNAEETARSAISNFTQSCVIWSSHFQGFL